MNVSVWWRGQPLLNLHWGGDEEYVTESDESPTITCPTCDTMIYVSDDPS